MKEYNVMIRSSTRTFCRGAVLLGCALGLANSNMPGQVQVSASDRKEGETQEQTVHMSPFVVNSTDDSGYMGTESLAGTRIKSNIRDVGSSISIVTKQFLDDTGIKNASELLNYTVSTETGGSQGNFSSVTLSTRFGEAEPGNMLANPQFATRVRGISAPDLTRDYFLTRIPFDSYNTERVEINRGANAILFGLGSPTGIINNSLAQPTFRDGGEADVRFGRFGSFRTSLDIDKVLVKGKLAARVAVLHDNEEYQQRPAFEKQDRYYAAVTWKPTASTTFRINGEKGKIDGNRPNPVSYSENISAWMLSGNPVIDNTPLFVKSPKGMASLANYLDKPYAQGGTRHPGLPSNVIIDLGGGAVYNSSDALRQGTVNFQGFWQFQSAAVFSNYNTVRPDASLDNLAGTDLPNPALASGPHPLDLDPTSKSGTPILGFLMQEPASFMYGAGYVTQGLNDRRAFDWVNNLLFGDAASQDSDFETFNTGVEQTFFGNKAGVNVTFDHQKFSQFDVNPVTELRGAIHIDNNVTLPVTPAGLNKPNPNYLRPYTFVSMQTSEFQEERNAVQATGFYQFDFREHTDSKWSAILGRHILTGIYSGQTIDERTVNRSPRWTDTELLRQSGSDNALNVQALAQEFIYLGPPIDPHARSMDDVEIHRLDGPILYDPAYANKITHWEPGVQPGTVNARANGTTLAGAQQILAVGGPTGMGNIRTNNTPYEMLAGGVSLSKTKIDSVAANLQSYWLWEKLVSTVGWRRDEVTLHQVGTGDLPKDLHGQTVFAGAKATDDKSPVNIKDDTITWSLVGYWPDKFGKLPLGSTLSAHFSKSSNFQPMAGRINEMGDSLPSPRGDTREYGITATMLNNRLSIRVNKYETNLLNASTSVVNYGSMPTLWIRWFGEGARNAESSYNTTGQAQYAAARDLNDAVAEYIISATPQQFKDLWDLNVLRNSSGKITGYTSAQPSGITDTQDIAAKGTEIELVFNPTRNWRLMANIAQEKAIYSNVNPISQAWRAWVKQKIIDATVPGYGNLKISELPAAITLLEYYPNKSGRARWGDAWAASSNMTTEESTALNFDLPLAKLVSQEGAESQELREWRFNLATTYEFRSGKLDGLLVGGAYRYQSKVAIGYAYMDIDGDGLLDAADVNSPYFGPAEDAVDVWVNYRLPFFREHGDWSVGLNVRNLLASEDNLIPIQTQTNGAIARYRYAPQRLIYLSSKFKF